MKRYRIEPYDPVHDIWVLEERFLFIFWTHLSCGPRALLEKFIDEQLGVSP